MIENKTHQTVTFIFLALSFYFLFIIFKLAEFSLYNNRRFQRNYNFSLFFVFITLVLATSYIIRNVSTYSNKGVDRRNLLIIILTSLVYFGVLMLVPSILDKF